MFNEMQKIICECLIFYLINLDIGGNIIIMFYKQIGQFDEDNEYDRYVDLKILSKKLSTFQKKPVQNMADHVIRSRSKCEKRCNMLIRKEGNQIQSICEQGTMKGERQKKLWYKYPKRTQSSRTLKNDENLTSQNKNKRSFSYKSFTPIKRETRQINKLLINCNYVGLTQESATNIPIKKQTKKIQSPLKIIIRRKQQIKGLRNHKFYEYINSASKTKILDIKNASNPNFKTKIKSKLREFQELQKRLQKSRLNQHHP